MDAVIVPPVRPGHGTLRLPADKAICHRVALLCALTSGSTEISPWSSAEDCQHTLATLERLGVTIRQTPSGLEIQGVGLTGLRAPKTDLYCGDSGTTMRLSAGLLAGQPFVSRLTAGPSLSRRPMRRIIEPLSQMGAQIKAISTASFEGNPPEDYPPLDIAGTRPLKGMTYALPVASAQVKSAILLAGLYANGPTTVIEPTITRDHTERLLSRIGVRIRRQDRAVTLEPPTQQLQAPGRLTIPGDPSSAAFFIVAAAILPGSRLIITDVGLNPTRSQFLEVLRRMGASIHVETRDHGWEPHGTITVEATPLHGTTIVASEVPALIDEIPILMVAACAAEGTTCFEGLQELRVKETDRLQAMREGLSLLNAHLLLHPNGDVVITKSPLRGRTVNSFRDHRTAMSLTIAGLLAEGHTRIQDCGCVAKSFGNFYECLASVVGPSTVKIVAP